MPGKIATNLSNVLAGETSPYLLQHAHNPVHWQPWNKKSLALAKKLKRPILLSVGYAACHWCHVMAHESFEDNEVAEVMNEHFINIKVDREERPDVDQIYMSALHALGEQGGWPLTMFLDSDGRPFWGGTYFPKQAKYGRPGFIDAMMAVHRTWMEEPDRIQHNTKALTEHLEKTSSPTAGFGKTAGKESIDGHAQNLLRLMDPVHGGIKGAPKFPNAPMMEVLWRHWQRQGDHIARDAFVGATTALCQGGIYDHLGGGLARYSTDARWLAPHFEKMLYDNAHFIRHLIWAHAVTKGDLFRVRIEETVAWLEKEMVVEGGAFASSLDADSEGEEGKFYVWQLDEITETLGEDTDTFIVEYDVTPVGNWEGTNILNRLEKPGLAPIELAASREKLLAVREKRVRPGRDDKVLTDWNGFMIRALAEAGAYFGNNDWIEIAGRAYRFITESIAVDGLLPHCWRDGRRVFPAVLSDLANMGLAALALYQTPTDSAYLSDAERYAARILEDYDDGTAGFALTARNATDLIVRPTSHQDEANPSPSSQTLELFTRLSVLTGDVRWSDHAEKLALSLSGRLEDATYGNAGFLNALDFYLGHQSLVIATGSNELGPWLEAAKKNFSTNRLDIFVPDQSNLPRQHPARAAKIDQTPCAFLCVNQTCSLPITGLMELGKELRPSLIRS